MESFRLIKKSPRVGVLKTKRGAVKTPFFMPVGTIGAVKTIKPSELKEIGTQIILANTYHLHLRPKEKFIKQKFGTLHNFMKWEGPILTDSGGYQVFSLAEKSKKGKSLVKIKENGVEFRSHIDGSKHFFTPESVIQMQLDLGSDIIMPLDVCPPANSSKKGLMNAVDLTIKWAKLARIYFDRKTKKRGNKKPLLFGIIQGGTDKKLREYCAKEIIKLDFDGYAIGGLAVGEEKRDLWKVLSWMDKIISQDKPRYLMGVGTPNDIIKATQLGMDMFDCVLPTRTARHGVAFVKKNRGYEEIDFRKSKLKNDKKPIDLRCQCPVSQEGFSRAYVHHLVKIDEILGIRLLTLHNLYTYLDLMKKLRAEY